MGSTRLPGKSLLDLAGAPLLGRILERVRRCKRIDQIVVATTANAEDDPIAELARTYDIAAFRGSEDDLVDRFARAAQAFEADIVGRLPADNPVPEPAEIDRIADYHRQTGNAFSTNLAEAFGNGYPDGIGAEMIDRTALEEVWRAEHDPRLREHPHLNFFDYATQTPVTPRYTVGTVQCPESFRRPDLVLDVNTQEEYQFMRALYGYLYPVNPQFHVTDVIDWYDGVYKARRAQ